MNPFLQEERNPWHFGFIPSDLVESLPCNAKKQLDDKAIEKADFLYKKTLECRLPKYLCKEFMLEAKKNIDKMENIYDATSLYLTLDNCKSGSLVSPNKALKGISEYLNKETLLSSKIAKVKTGSVLVASFSEELAEEGVENYRRGGKKNDVFYHIVNGIILGYPLGDVFGFVSRKNWETTLPMFERWASVNDYKKNLGILIHVPMPYFWPKKWKEKVGIKGEEILASTYREHLKKWDKVCYG